MSSFNEIWKAERKLGYYLLHLNLLVSLIFVTCALLYLLYDRYILWKQRDFIKINARLTKIYNSSTSTFIGTTYYNCQANITYVIGSKKYNTTANFNLSFKPKIGDVGQILYNPSDPTQIIVTHQFTEMVRGIYSTLFSLNGTGLKIFIPLIILLNIMYFYRNNKYLQTLFGLQIIGYVHTLLDMFMPSYPF
jgi:hypothetical protein